MLIRDTFTVPLLTILIRAFLFPLILECLNSFLLLFFLLHFPSLKTESFPFATFRRTFRITYFFKFYFLILDNAVMYFDSFCLRSYFLCGCNGRISPSRRFSKKEQECPNPWLHDCILHFTTLNGLQVIRIPPTTEFSSVLILVYQRHVSPASSFIFNGDLIIVRRVSTNACVSQSSNSHFHLLWLFAHLTRTLKDLQWPR